MGWVAAVAVVWALIFVGLGVVALVSMWLERWTRRHMVADKDGRLIEKDPKGWYHGIGDPHAHLYGKRGGRRGRHG